MISTLFNKEIKSIHYIHIQYIPYIQRCIAVRGGGGGLKQTSLLRRRARHKLPLAISFAIITQP